MKNDYHNRHWLVYLPHNGSKHICGFCKSWKQDNNYDSEGKCSNKNVEPSKYMKMNRGFDCEAGIVCCEFENSGVIYD